MNWSTNQSIIFLNKQLINESQINHQYMMTVVLGGVYSISLAHNMIVVYNNRRHAFVLRHRNWFHVESISVT